MKKIVVTFKFEKDQKKMLESMLKDKAEIEYLKDLKNADYDAIIGNADILFSWNPTRELADVKKNSFNNIEFIQLLSAGYDHIDFNWFPSNCNIASNKGAYAAPMAEHIIAMILAIYKNLFLNHIRLPKGEFNQKGLNRSLKDSVCGILGFGGIGKAAANLLRPFGTKIYAINSTGKTNERVDFIGTLNDLEYLLKNSDIIIISLPLNNETNELIDNNKLELMKHDAILVNVARGQIIVEKDLYEHLESHPEFSACIDAWWVEPFTEGEFKVNYPFFELSNLLGSPHNSAIVPGIILHAIHKAAGNILKYLEGKKVEIVNH